MPDTRHSSAIGLDLSAHSRFQTHLSSVAFKGDSLWAAGGCSVSRRGADRRESELMVFGDLELRGS
ncbi:hypothetical protein [Limnohabitans sp. 2KL-3]|uniref:hypothetical protein n=1 Tax=Limnohabitans sp. 2KL-3 TaxID=1100700 RepID=UPI000B018E39|nr:hypothetical protein [Limnohabitans sp. 2KL-3]